MPSPFLEVQGFIQGFPDLMMSIWWLWTFVGLIFLVPQLWLAYIQEYYKKTVLRPVLLELRIPREVRKTPRAMEQVFFTIHALKNSPSNVKEKWWDGEVPLWFSCEVASFGGELHFYLRVPSKHRNMIEAALYAQYQDVEVVEVKDDYVNRFPSTYEELFSQGYQFFGNELVLAKEDAYPIKTYFDFEAVAEEKELDPVSALMECLAKIKPQEHLWVQIVVRPMIDDSWRVDAEARVVKVLKEKSKTEVVTPTGRFTWAERSPGELDALKAIERNISKPGFRTIVRYVYIAPKDMYDGNFGQRGVYSAFNQYASESLNKFRHNSRVWTRSSFWHWPHLFPERRRWARRVRMWRNYRNRRIPDELFLSKVRDMNFFHWGIGGQSVRMVLNTEELATIYHLPTYIVLTAPIIKRMESRKIGPPAGLPIYGEGSEELPLKK